MMTEWAIPPSGNHPGFAVGDTVESTKNHWTSTVIGTKDSNGYLCIEYVTPSYLAGMGRFPTHIVNGRERPCWTVSLRYLVNRTRGPDARHKMRIEGNELILEKN